MAFSRRLITDFPKGYFHTIACMGDSLTHNTTLGVPLDLAYPSVLEANLRALDYAVRVRNFGHSGDTSTQMVARVAQLTRYDIPKLGIIWAGANDPGNGIVGATTQANIQSIATTLFNAGTEYVVIGNTQYLNYSTGGDTTAAQSATYATLKTFQLAAYTALLAAHPGKVAYCDTYAYMRALIVAGTVTQGSFSWHVADSNQHLNALGNSYVAAAMQSAILAQTAWLPDLE